jgi:hypothetical protein
MGGLSFEWKSADQSTFFILGEFSLHESSLFARTRPLKSKMHGATVLHVNALISTGIDYLASPAACCLLAFLLHPNHSPDSFIEIHSDLQLRMKTFVFFTFIGGCD